MVNIRINSTSNFPRLTGARALSSSPSLCPQTSQNGCVVGWVSSFHLTDFASKRWRQMTSTALCAGHRPRGSTVLGVVALSIMHASGWSPLSASQCTVSNAAQARSFICLQQFSDRLARGGDFSHFGRSGALADTTHRLVGPCLLRCTRLTRGH